MRIVVVSWRDLDHPQAGGCELLVDHLLTGLADRGHDVALVAARPVSDHGYPVYPSGGTYTQYLGAPLLCAMRFRKADLIIDVQNGLPFLLSPLAPPSLDLPRPPQPRRSVGHAIPPASGRRGQGDRAPRHPRPLPTPSVCSHLSSTADGLKEVGVDASVTSG